MFAKVSIWQLWNALAMPFVGTLGINSFKSDAQLVLIKFADGMIHEESTPTLEGLNLKYFILMMMDLCNSAGRLFETPDSLNMPEIQDISSSIRLHLDIFETCLDTTNNPLSLTDTTQVAEILIGRLNFRSLLTVDFLAILHKYIPIQGLSKTSTTIANPLPSSISDLFKGMKRDIIVILTQLLHLDKKLQDTIREKGGIPLILAQTNIDDDNPC